MAGYVESRHPAAIVYLMKYMLEMASLRQEK